MHHAVLSGLPTDIRRKEISRTVNLVRNFESFLGRYLGRVSMSLIQTKQNLFVFAGR